MKRSSVILTLILILGIVYSLFSLSNGHGAGLGDSMDGIAWTSIILFITSLTILIRNRKELENHIVTFIFLVISLPITFLVSRNIIQFVFERNSISPVTHKDTTFQVVLTPPLDTGKKDFEYPPQTPPPPIIDEAERIRVFDTISNLPEVKRLSKKVAKDLKGKAEVVVLVTGFPSKDFNYYWVKVASVSTNLLPDATELTNSIYQFNVAPKTLEIKYWIPAQDTAIDLMRYRSQHDSIHF